MSPAEQTAEGFIWGKKEKKKKEILNPSGEWGGNWGGKWGNVGPEDVCRAGKSIALCLYRGVLPVHPRTGFGAWSCLNQGFLPCLRDRESANPSVALRPILSPAEASLRAEEPAETLAGQAQEGSFGPTAPAYPAHQCWASKKKRNPNPFSVQSPARDGLGAGCWKHFPLSEGISKAQASPGKQ